MSERVRVVGTAEGAALMQIPAGRFTRLARLGLLVPAKWYLNRYRAVVWLYLAEDLRNFTLDPRNAHLLKGRTPETLRGQLEAGVDLRARNWRGRQLGFLLRRAEDPWARAGAVAAFLPPIEIADVVKNPYERAYLNRFRPMPPGRGAAGSPAAHLAERITTAQDADEIDWLRGELAHSVEEARSDVPAPRPDMRRAAPTVRATARPIPPLARTVTRAAESRELQEHPVVRVPGPHGEPVLGTPESTGEPMAGASGPKAERVVGACAPDGEQAAPAPGRDYESALGAQEGDDGPVFGAPWPDGAASGRASERHRAPLVRQARPPARRDRRSEQDPAPANRGLRGWLRRRSPRTTRI
ncbi:hypothetical protein ADK64_39750 [Streptomyces sp. MMG1121]|nr:hypothetical protein ADK64_39750 [Streptomyces sp. MMG1121]